MCCRVLFNKSRCAPKMVTTRAQKCHKPKSVNYFQTHCETSSLGMCERVGKMAKKHRRLASAGADRLSSPVDVNDGLSLCIENTHTETGAYGINEYSMEMCTHFGVKNRNFFDLYDGSGLRGKIPLDYLAVWLADA